MFSEPPNSENGATSTMSFEEVSHVINAIFEKLGS